MSSICTALLGALSILGVAGAACANASAPSLRIVSEGHPDAKAYRDNIAVALEACQLKLGLPRSTAGLPSEAFLSTFKVRQEERLFDGPLAASYETQSEITPDPSQGCKLRVARSFGLQIDKSCEWRLYGNSGLLGEDGPGRSSPLTEERTSQPDCKVSATIRPGLAAAQAKAPRHNAGLGQQCIWDGEVMAILAGETPKDAAEGGCLLAEMPIYPYSSYQGRHRTVALTHHLNDETRGGTKLAKHFGAVAGIFNARLVSFDKGLRIPADRFSRSGAEAFLAQPRWVNLGDLK